MNNIFHEPLVTGRHFELLYSYEYFSRGSSAPSRKYLCYRYETLANAAPQEAAFMADVIWLAVQKYQEIAYFYLSYKLTHRYKVTLFIVDNLGVSVFLF